MEAEMWEKRWQEKNVEFEDRKEIRDVKEPGLS